MKSLNIKKIFNLFVIISILGLSIFAQDSGNRFSKQKWIPVSIEGNQVKNTKAFISFSESGNVLTGNAGCNRLFGEFEMKGKSLKFSEIGTTKMFCADEDSMKTETSFLNILNKTTSFKKSGNTMKLFVGKRQIAKLKTIEPKNSETGNASEIKLEDKKWILEKVENKSIGKVSETAFIIFNKEKQSAGGNTSCNVFGANYETDGKNLKITQGIQTFRACIEDERMNIEREFMNGLQKTDRYEIKGDNLFLYQDTRLLLTFKAGKQY
ncbi:MAG TPA: META domain-containing protein [Pyrinomonadaceae bacterium]|nr:META domain-containing protein [Pyrinomonadaceae bacterium]